MKKLMNVSIITTMLISLIACSENPMQGDEDLILNEEGVLKTTIVEEIECVEETAWVGDPDDRYLAKGNWAFWTPIVDWPNTVDIIAGRHEIAGVVRFYDPNPNVDGKIWIKFYLDWCLQDVEEPIKIMGYDNPPIGGDPSPGTFLYKFTQEEIKQGNPYIYVEIPPYNYYGIHLDLQNCCE